MINKEIWMPDLIAKLNKQFGKRLLFVGLQGSYQREEADESSDIDVVIIIEELSLKDLNTYRSIIQTMPECEKICGFFCGKKELCNWPRYEIFQLQQDTKSYVGTLDDLIPAYDNNDIRQSIKIAAANLFHASCHNYLFGNPEARTTDLKMLFKSIFFILQLAEYLRTGQYHCTKSELRQHLTGNEKIMLEISMRREESSDEIRTNPENFYEMLIEWCKKTLAG